MQDSATIIAQHVADKKTSQDFKERRFIQWNENHALYRDKVSTNRLTQRQPVNLPLIREAIQIWISKNDEAPMMKFETRGQGDSDKEQEIVLNELWNYYYDDLGLDIVDNIDKKVVGLQGRSFKKWGFSKNKIYCDVLDPYDVEVDPRVNVLDLNSADFVIHTHIFKSLRSILANKDYDEKGKNELKQFLETKQGLLKAKQDKESYDMKIARLEALGVQNYDNFVSGDVLVEINESYKMVWNPEENRFVRHLMTIATDSVLLSNKPMKEAIGLTRLPIVTWASDPDLNDLWSDGIADSMRTVNKIINMYFSQDLENRTYRNFGMYFFNTLNGTFQPRAFDPKPFGMYGVPGNPDEIVKQMDINPLGDTSAQITWLKDLMQSSIAQTPTERGQIQSDTTLGQTQLSFQQSQQQNQVGSKNYRRAWKESGLIFYELLKENSNGAITLFKKGSDGKYYAKEVRTEDWLNPLGYECKVVTQAEGDAASDFDLKKIQYVKNSFATNPVAIKIAKKKELELVNWTPEEIDAVMQAEGQTESPFNPVQEAPSMVNNPQDSTKDTNALAMRGFQPAVK
jgi:hypothetical protein